MEKRPADKQRRSSPEGSRRGAAVELQLTAPIAEAPLLREQVYRQLRGAILSGELPRGGRLSPSQLASQMGISTMPVREALRLLEEDGLIEMSARRWTRVASPDWELAEQAYPLFALLEEFAVATGSFFSPEQLDHLAAANGALRAAFEAGDIQSCLDADNHFHAAITENNSNTLLQRMLGDLKVRVALLESAFFQNRHSALISIQQHEDALAAARAGDLEQAGAHIRANWQHGLEVVRRAAAAQ